jgi:hypothetical protein
MASIVESSSASPEAFPGRLQFWAPSAMVDHLIRARARRSRLELEPARPDGEGRLAEGISIEKPRRKWMRSWRRCGGVSDSGATARRTFSRAPRFGFTRSSTARSIGRVGPPLLVVALVLIMPAQRSQHAARATERAVRWLLRLPAPPPASSGSFSPRRPSLEPQWHRRAPGRQRGNEATSRAEAADSHSLALDRPWLPRPRLSLLVSSRRDSFRRRRPQASRSLVPAMKSTGRRLGLRSILVVVRSPFLSFFSSARVYF